ncbi:RCC1 domain-containing protein 1 [Octopus sinensis]|uniref:RCC1 domain-containing protein 1 n=1 Tax=Octopus sinensis TaxID=2607531 RepID=A0A6P7TEJ1_9MOLL|nr:RCC1 domain-containing protein 1 [Octopus sinensis]
MSEVWACGFNGFSQLTADSIESKIKTLQAIHLGLEDKEKLTECEISWSFIAWLTDQHRLITCGFSPDKLDASVKPALQATTISVLSSHLIVMDSNSTLQEWRHGHFMHVSLKGVENFKPKQIHSKEMNCVAISEENVPVEISPVYHQSSIEYICKPLPLGCAIRSVACGVDHVLMLSDFGSVFSYGSGSRGQTGHGTTEDICGQPKVIEALEGVRMVLIASGNWHSAAVSEFGDLYMWGWNECGQLGILCRKNLDHEFKITDDCSEKNDAVTIQALPYLVLPPDDKEEDIVVAKVACGARHTAVLTNCCKLFTCGWNGYGQLGLGDCYNRDRLTYVQDQHLPSLKCQPEQLDIYCGSWNTILVLQKTETKTET